MTSDEWEDMGRIVRRLMRRCSRVALGTLDREGGGPYVSLAMVALDLDATPLLHLSDLADHTRNIKADARVSLLFDGTLGQPVPLAGERASVQGRAAPTTDPRLLARYLARQPDARAYAGFRDFYLYRVEVERAHLVAGFGRIRWVTGDAVRLASAVVERLVPQERALVERLSTERRDLLARCARRQLADDVEGWTLTGLDPEGCDLGRGAESARLWFDEAAAVLDAAGVEAELRRLAGGTAAAG